VGTFLTLAAIKEALNEMKKPSPDARKIPGGFDVEKAELSLSDGDFQGYFKMDKPTYTALPAWKRKRLREKVLFG
jgi:predicted membrane metal-binding protein